MTIYGFFGFLFSDETKRFDFDVHSKAMTVSELEKTRAIAKRHGVVKLFSAVIFSVLMFFSWLALSSSLGNLFSDYGVAVMAVYAVATFALFLVSLLSLLSALEYMASAKRFLSDDDGSGCLELVDHMNCRSISNFCRDVASEGRKLTVGEVKALKEELKKHEIHRACSKIYTTAL